MGGRNGHCPRIRLRFKTIEGGGLGFRGLGLVWFRVRVSGVGVWVLGFRVPGLGVVYGCFGRPERLLTLSFRVPQEKNLHQKAETNDTKHI